MSPTMFPQLCAPLHEEPAVAAPPTVRRVTRTDPLLRRGPFADRPNTWTLDFARDTAVRCAFQPATAQAEQPGEETILLADGLTEQLKNQLSRIRPKPEIVLIGLETDPFLPSPVLQSELVKVIRLLAEFRITSWLTTRNPPLPAVLDALAAHRGRVRVTIALATVDPVIQRVLEPHCATVDDRLHLIADLQAREVPIEVDLEPLLPGLTDTRERLKDLLEPLAALGIRQITTGYLVLRPGVKELLWQALEPHGWAETTLGEYNDGPILRDGVRGAARYLRKSKRQRGYAALMALAAAHEIEVRVGRLTNPDFLPPRRPDAVHAAQVHHMIQSFRQSMGGSMSAAGA